MCVLVKKANLIKGKESKGSIKGAIRTTYMEEDTNEHKKEQVRERTECMGVRKGGENGYLGRCSSFVFVFMSFLILYFLPFFQLFSPLYFSLLLFFCGICSD